MRCGECKVSLFQLSLILRTSWRISRPKEAVWSWGEYGGGHFCSGIPCLILRCIKWFWKGGRGCTWKFFVWSFCSHVSGWREGNTQSFSASRSVWIPCVWAGFLVSTKSKQNYIVAGQESVTPCQWIPTAPSVWGSCDRGREGTGEVITGTGGDSSAVSCLGLFWYHYAIPHAAWLKQQKLLFSQFMEAGGSWSRCWCISFLPECLSLACRAALLLGPPAFECTQTPCVSAKHSSPTGWRPPPPMASF